METIHDRTSKNKRAKKRKPYFRWTDEERYIVGIYALQNGTEAVARHYQSKYAGHIESTVRLSQRGGIISRNIAVSVATVLLEKDESLGKIKITET